MQSVTRATICSLTLFPVLVLGQATQIMRTIGGGYLGDGGLATRAGLYEIRRVAVAPDGTLYVADKSNHRVRRITPDGRISTVAGNGESGFSGDGGPANLARLYFPEAVALDKDGNLYIADVINSRVRKVSKNGIISTYVGNGTAFGFTYGASALAQSAGYPKSLTFDSAGNLYVCDRDYYRVYKVSPQGVLTLVAGNPSSPTSTGDNGPSTSATVSRPTSVAIGPDNSIYISELTGNKIRRVAPNGIITTFAGTGELGFADGPAATAKFNQPEGMWMVGNDLYVADALNHRVRRIRNGIVSTIAGTGEPGFSGDNGPAERARLRDVRNVIADAQGNLIIADMGNGRIRKIDARTGVITTIAGAGSTIPNGDGGPALGSFFLAPTSVFLDPSGSLLITDFARNRIRAIDKLGLVSTWAGGGEEGALTGDGGPLINARFASPRRVATDRRGTYYIADTDNNRVRRISPQGIVSTLAGTTQGNSGDDGPATRAQFDTIRSIAVHPVTNDVYIADSKNHCIRYVDGGGILHRFAGICGTPGFSGDNGDPRSARLNEPYDITFDSKGTLYIADWKNQRVRRVQNGIITTYAGDGRNVNETVLSRQNLNYGGPALQAAVGDPQALAVDKDDNLYIATAVNVTRVDVKTNIISLVAGDGTYQYKGDNGPATQATVNNPQGIAVDNEGNIYVADVNNARIRLITTAAATSTITFRTDPPGQAIVVDGQELSDGQQVRWIAGSAHRFSTRSIQGTGDTRYVFERWNNGSTAAAQQVTAGPANAVFIASFRTQHKLTVAVNGAGFVDFNPPLPDDGFYDAGTAVSLSPIPEETWTFAGFSGDADGSDAALVTLSAPKRVIADFAAPIPDLSVSPANLTFRFQEGGQNPAEQLLTVASTGASIGFDASADAPFVRLAAEQSTTPGLIHVALNGAGLAAGSYSASIQISSPSGAAPVTIPVAIEVTPAPVKPTLQVNPGVLDLNVTTADQQLTRFVDAASSGSPLRLGWEVKTGAQWLVVQAVNTSDTPAKFRIDALPQGLPPGSHSGRIEFSSPDSSNGPQVLLVNLNIQPEAPKEVFPSTQRLSFQYKQKRLSPGVPPSPQQLDVISNPSGLRVFPRAAFSSQTPWLTVRTGDASAGSAAPTSVSVEASGAGLDPGLYEGSVEFRLEPNGPIVSRVPVQLEVLPPAPLALTSDRPDVRFDVPSGSPSPSVVWRIDNKGEEPVQLDVVSNSDSPWLRASGERTFVTADDPGLIRVTADTSGLAPGTYAGTVQAGTGDVKLQLQVVLTVNASARKIAAAERSIKIIGKSGDSLGRYLDLLVDGQGAVPWSATTTTERGGNWLRVRPPSGTITGGQPQRVTIETTGLPAGLYGGRIRIESPQTANAEEIVVNLEITADRDAPPDVDRAGIILVATGGNETNRIPIEILYPKLAGRDVSISVQPSNWLRTSSSSVRLSSGPGLATFQVWAQASGLAPGQYQGTVMLSFTDGQRIPVSVALVVPGGLGNVISSKIPGADGCQPTQYTSVFASPQGMNVRVGEAAKTEFVLVDNCGSLLTDGAVSTSFSSGDRPVDLRPLGDGVWRASWSPRLGEASGIALQVDAIGPNGALPVSSPRLVTFLTGRSDAPLIDRRAPFLTPGQREYTYAVAPGGRVIIRGERLSDVRIQSSTPAPQLGNTRVTLGGLPMQLLSVAPDEIEAIVPESGLSQHVAHPLIVSRGQQLSAPEPLSVADSWPTIVAAGAARTSGVDLILTHVNPGAKPQISIEAGGTPCVLSGIEPVRKEPGFYYARATGCGAAAGASIQVHTSKSRAASRAVVKPQARRGTTAQAISQSRER